MNLSILSLAGPARRQTAAGGSARHLASKRRRADRPRLGLRLLVGMALGGVACRGDDRTPDPASQQPTENEPPAPTNATSEAHDAGEQPESRGLFGWFDPDAIAGTFGRETDELDLAALATVFGLPPRARALVLANRELSAALAAISTTEHPVEGSIWRSSWTTFAPPLARGPYIVRELAIPRNEAIERFSGSHFREEHVDGFSVLVPEGAFPWKVVLLDAVCVAFIPRAEIGSGLSPLTAARDLPTGEVASQLRRDSTESDIVLASYTAGPMLHFDLTDDVHHVQLALRRWQARGLDGAVALVLTDAAAADRGVSEATKREGLGETQVIRELMRKVAFTAEGQAVTGRLQILAEDVPRAGS